MASGSLGAVNLKVWHSERTGIRFCIPQSVYGNRSLTLKRMRVQVRTSTAVSPEMNKALAVSCGPLVGNQPAIEKDDENLSANLSSPPSKLIPSTHEVEFLLKELCGTNSVSEFDLKLRGFHLHVKRDLNVQNLPPPLPRSAPVALNSTPNPSVNGSVASSTLAITKPSVSEGKVVTYVDKAADGGLVLIQSPRVGFFRRSRTIKGKRAPPSCKERQIVKEGQVICYIEQLGGELPVESDVSGEIVKILLDDGEPVGYGDPVIAILPSFPGIKKLPLDG